MAHKKEQTYTFKYDGRNWSGHAKDKTGLARLLKVLSSKPNNNGDTVPMATLSELEAEDVRIIAVVAEHPTFMIDDDKGGYMPSSVRLECGRAAAQAAHVVSRLKMSYIDEMCRKGIGRQAHDLVQHVMRAKVTTIVLKARDTSELQHIEFLAGRKQMHCLKFYDENDDFYNRPRGGQVQTAIAIGPYRAEEFHGITDYLPLWKCKCDIVP